MKTLGFRFRKSINLGGGAKINLSKSGVGFSWGTKGMRFTKKATGGKRTTFSIPGTGISHITESSKSSKKKASNTKSGSVAKTNEMKSTDSNSPKVPFYKKSWFKWAVLVIGMITIFDLFANGDDIDDKKKDTTSTTTTVVSTTKAWNDLTDNPELQNYSGLYESQYGWCYLINGVIDLTYNGTATNQYGTFNVKDGFVDWDNPYVEPTTTEVTTIDSLVWVKGDSECYHCKEHCHNMRGAYQVKRSKAIAMGKTSCDTCKPG